MKPRLMFKGGLATLLACVALLIACSKRPIHEPLSTASNSPADVSLGKSKFRSSKLGFQAEGRDLFARVAPTGETTVSAKRSNVGLTVQTMRAGRTGNALKVAAQGPTLLDEGDVENTLGNVRERIEMRSDGVEVSWRFEARPEGTGDLVVRQRIEHKGKIHKQRPSIRFVDEHLLVSQGTFIDADGHRTTIPVDIVDGALEYRVSAHVVEASRFPAVLDPTISVEVELDPRSSPGIASQSGDPNTYPASVFDGEKFYVAWYDARGISPSIMGGFVSVSGELVTDSVRVLGEVEERLGGEKWNLIRVVPGPGGFLVAWINVETRNVSMVRVSSAGNPVDPKPIRMGSFVANPLQGYIPFDDLLGASSDAFLYVTIDQKIEVHTLAAATSPDPQLNQYELEIKANDGEHLYGLLERDMLLIQKRSWATSQIEDYSIRLGKSQMVTPPKLILPPRADSDGWLLGMAWNGTTYALHFGGSYYGGNAAPYLRTLSVDGSTLGPPVSVSDSWGLLLQSDGSQFFLRAIGGNWVDNEYIYESRSCTWDGVASTPNCTTKTGIEDRLLQNEPSSPPALSPTRFVLPGFSTSYPARGALPALYFFDRTYARATPHEVILTRSSSRQFAPTVSFSPSLNAYLAVWIDDADAEANGGAQVKGALISPFGSSLKVGEPFDVSPAGASTVSDPQVIWDGATFVVGWIEGRNEGGNDLFQIVASKVAANKLTATVATPVTVAVAPKNLFRSIALSADGAAWNFAWSEYEEKSNGERVWQLFGKSVLPTDSNPAVVDKIALSARNSDDRSEVAAAFDGTKTVIVWLERSRNSDKVFVSTYAIGKQPSPMRAVFDDSFSFKENLRIASDQSTGSLVVWASAEGRRLRNVRGKFLSREPQPLSDTTSSIPIAAVEKSDEAFPAVAYSNDGENYLVAWSERLDIAGADWNLVGNWVTLDGRVLDAPPGRWISSTTTEAVNAADGGTENIASGEDESLPALTTGPSSTVGVAYTRFDSRKNALSLRARFRTVTSGKKSGETCSTSEECATRYCVDGICCKSACNDGCGQCGGDSTHTPGTCSPLPATTVCGATGRYTCSGNDTRCPSSCETSAANVCAPSYSCRDGMCNAFSAVCIDEFTAATETGPVSCGAYRCVDGACRGVCKDATECAPGSVCDFKGRCGEPPPINNAEDSCTFASKPSRQSSPAPMGILLLCASLGGWRRWRRGREAA